MPEFKIRKTIDKQIAHPLEKRFADHVSEKICEADWLTFAPLGQDVPHVAEDAVAQAQQTLVDVVLELILKVAKVHVGPPRV